MKWFLNLFFLIFFSVQSFANDYIDVNFTNLKLDEFIKFKPSNIAEDKDGHLVYMAQSEWFLNTERTNNPEIEFHFSSEINK